MVMTFEALAAAILMGKGKIKSFFSVEIFVNCRKETFRTTLFLGK